jgi:NADH-quinone oxidoreductase subunit N
MIFLFLIVLHNYTKKKILLITEFSFLLITALLASFLAISAVNLFSLVLSFELLSLVSYILLGLYTQSVSKEAAIKYFIASSASGGLLLQGSALIYSCYGTLEFNALHLVLTELGTFDLVSKFGFLFIFFGFFIKLAVFPGYN